MGQGVIPPLSKGGGGIFLEMDIGCGGRHFSKSHGGGSPNGGGKLISHIMGGGKFRTFCNKIPNFNKKIKKSQIYKINPTNFISVLISLSIPFLFIPNGIFW